jgi:hypothetical protein
MRRAYFKWHASHFELMEMLYGVLFRGLFIGLRGFAIFSSVVKGAEDHGRGGLYHPPLVFFGFHGLAGSWGPLFFFFFYLYIYI